MHSGVMEVAAVLLFAIFFSKYPSTHHQEKVPFMRVEQKIFCRNVCGVCMYSFICIFERFSDSCVPNMNI